MYNIFTNGPFFEWDESKNAANQRKHGVSFQEARSVFLDGNAQDAVDSDHSHEEDRFILVGMSDRSRVLLVSYCYRSEYSILRIISARKLNKKEEAQYWRMIE